MLARPFTSVVTKAMVQKNSRKLALPDAVRSGAHPGKVSASPRLRVTPTKANRAPAHRQSQLSHSQSPSAPPREMPSHRRARLTLAADVQAQHFRAS